jgi:aldehyde:ferredoxin oxidoreductase
MVEMVHRIGKREGLGQLLGEGVRRASQSIGKGSERLAIHIKGLETPAHDARSSKLFVLTMGAGSRGFCHTHQCEGMVYDSLKMDLGLVPYGFPDPETLDRFAVEGKAELAKKLQDFMIWPDILGICKFFTYFGGLLPGEVSRLLSLLTGWDIDGGYLAAVGERTFNLQRKFNVREGIRKKDDMLPERCRELPEFGPFATVEECAIGDNEGLLGEYYVARGWDEDGIPLDRDDQLAQPMSVLSKHLPLTRSD